MRREVWVQYCLKERGLRCKEVCQDARRQRHNAHAHRDQRDHVVRGHISGPSIGVFADDVGSRSSSHNPAVGLSRVLYRFFALLLLLLRSMAPFAHLLWLPTLFFSWVIPLVTLGILRYPKQFLEALGLFVALFCEP